MHKVPQTREEADALIAKNPELTDVTDPRWRDDAACLKSETNPEVFFPTQTGSSKAAVRVCSGCPVRDACLAYAIATNQRYGVWGGRTTQERDRLVKGDTSTRASRAAEKRARRAEQQSQAIAVDSFSNAA